MNILIFDEEKERREFLFYKLQFMDSFKPVLCNPIKTEVQQIELFSGSIKKVPHPKFPQMSTFPYDTQITEKDIILVNATTYPYVSIANEIAEEKLLPFVFTQSNPFVRNTHEFPIIVGVHDSHLRNVINKKDEESLISLTNRLHAICKKIKEEKEFIEQERGKLGYYRRYIGTAELFKKEPFPTKNQTLQLF